MAVALTALALLPGDAPIGAYLCCYLLLGIGYGMLNAPLSTVAVASMPKEQAGVGGRACVSSGRNIGIVLGIAALGSLVAAKLPAEGTVHEFAAALRPGVPAGRRRPASVATVVARGTLRAVPPDDGGAPCPQPGTAPRRPVIAHHRRPCSRSSATWRPAARIAATSPA